MSHRLVIVVKLHFFLERKTHFSFFGVFFLIFYCDLTFPYFVIEVYLLTYVKQHLVSKRYLFLFVNLAIEEMLTE